MIDIRLPSLYTRSFDLDRTSFRVEGNEGDMERMYQTLGLGPEDFSISEEDWEPRKIRAYSDLLPTSRLYQLDSLDSPKPDELTEVVADLCDRVGDVTVTVTELTRADSAGPSGLCNAAAAATTSTTGGGVCNGIMGVRKPVLKPPPSIRVPVVDNGCSTWDLLRGFAPEGEGDSVQKRLESSSSASSCCGGEEEGEVGEESAVEAGVRVTVPRSEGCSFTTSNDDDSSGTGTTPVSANERFLPNGRLKLIITQWEKGDLLGSGSFGSVYEAISELLIGNTRDMGFQRIYGALDALYWRC